MGKRISSPVLGRDGLHLPIQHKSHRASPTLFSCRGFPIFPREGRLFPTELINTFCCNNVFVLFVLKWRNPVWKEPLELCRASPCVGMMEKLGFCLRGSLGSSCLLSVRETEGTELENETENQGLKCALLVVGKCKRIWDVLPYLQT